jgi:hypothetical protein
MANGHQLKGHFVGPNNAKSRQIAHATISAPSDKLVARKEVQFPDDLLGSVDL